MISRWNSLRMGAAFSAVLLTSISAQASSLEGTFATVAGKKSENCFLAYLIRKVASKWDHERHKVSFQIALTNVGNCPLFDTLITDFFPEDVKFEEAFPKPDFRTNNRAEWRLEFLPVARTAFIDIEFKTEERKKDPDCDKDQDGRGHDGDQDKDRDKDQDQDKCKRRVINIACAWNNFIGQRICDSAVGRPEGHPGLKPAS